MTELKSLMDNVFFSMASGVLTTDIQDRIVLCNRAAENILGHVQQELVGNSLNDLISGFAISIHPHVQEVLSSDQTIAGLEMAQSMPNRGTLDLRLSISPLKDDQQNTQGVAIVMEDLTEKKSLEAQRRLFERMVSPKVIQQLDPNSLQLGGNRMEITTVFADVRGFTSFSEKMSPEDLVKVLNRYLGLCADCV